MLNAPIKLFVQRDIIPLIDSIQDHNINDQIKYLNQGGRYIHIHNHTYTFINNSTSSIRYISEGNKIICPHLKKHTQND